MNDADGFMHSATRRCQFRSARIAGWSMYAHTHVCLDVSARRGRRAYDRLRSHYCHLLFTNGTQTHAHSPVLLYSVYWYILFYASYVHSLVFRCRLIETYIAQLPTHTHSRSSACNTVIIIIHIFIYREWKMEI